MTGQDFVALAPYLAIATGSVVLLLLISFLRNTAAAFGLTLITLLISAGLLADGLEAPWKVGELLLLDGYTGIVNLIIVTAALVTAVLGRGYLTRVEGQKEEFFVLLLLATLGAMTLAGAAHFATLVLGLEILSVALYVLIGYPDQGHPPLEAALKYLVLSGVASTTLLFGVALIYNATGALTITGQVLPEQAPSGAEVYLLTGNALVLAGMAFKLSLVPFHLWTPDVYQGAPAPVSGYLAAVSKTAMFAFLLRYALTAGVLEQTALTSLLVLLALLSMIGGNLLALLQENVKRMLAYSSIAHVGYLLVALLAVSTAPEQALAVEASLIYLAGYVLTTLAAFGVISVLRAAGDPAEAEDLSRFAGLFWKRPLEAAIMTLALLSLTGIPLTAGFIIKFYLFTAGVAGELWTLLWALVLGSAIAVYYYLRVILTMARRPETEAVVYSGPAPDGVAALVIVSVSLVSFGVFPSPLIELVRTALGVTGG